MIKKKRILGQRLTDTNIFFWSSISFSDFNHTFVYNQNRSPNVQVLERKMIMMMKFMVG